MKKYEIRKEKIEVMCRVCSIIECMVNEFTDDVNRYNEDDEWSTQMKETYQVRLETVKELLNFLQTNDKNLPWNKEN